MKQLVCPAHGLVELAETIVPTINPGELLVRLTACGICGTDLMKVYSQEIAKPVQLGHEVVATVEHIGAGLSQFELGERVALAHHVPDYSSHYSRRGSEPMDASFKRSNIDPGGFAEFIRLPSLHVNYTVVPVPETVPDMRAIFMEPLACCLRALDRVTVLEGDTVLIVGAGATGSLFVPLCRDRGATVLAADLRPERLRLAETWGAQAGFLVGQDDLVSGCRDHSSGRGADLVILTVVDGNTLTLIQNAVRDGGTLLLYGVKPGEQVVVNFWDLWQREINLISSYSATPDLLPRAMAILSRPEYALETTIGHILPLAEAQTGFDLAHQGQASKVVITP